MIWLTRLNGEPIVVNAALLESVEATPDTLVCYAGGQRLVVRETIADVIAGVLDYQRRIRPLAPAEPPAPGDSISTPVFGPSEERAGAD